MLMLAFANEYQAPAILPQQWGFKWWSYVFSQKSLVSSITQSFIVAIITTGAFHGALYPGGVLHRTLQVSRP